VEIIETFYKGLGGKFLLNPVKKKIQGGSIVRLFLSLPQVYPAKDLLSGFGLFDLYIAANTIPC